MGVLGELVSWKLPGIADVAPYQTTRLFELVYFDVCEQIVYFMFFPPVFRVFELLEGFLGDEAPRAQKTAVGSQYPTKASALVALQQSLVVVAGFCLPVASSGRVVTLFLGYVLELVELRLLIVRKVCVVAGRVLERLDTLEVRHSSRTIQILQVIQNTPVWRVRSFSQGAV